MIVDHLRLAEQHVAEGAAIIARQKELVAQLERDGHDITHAAQILAQFEESQSRHEAEVVKLSQELLGRDLQGQG